jgi:hypothetical protein
MSLRTEIILTEIYDQFTIIVYLLTDQFPPELFCPFDSPYLEEFERVQNNMDEVRDLYVLALLQDASPNDPMDDYLRQRYSEIIMDLVKIDKEHFLYSDTPRLEEEIQKLRSCLDQLEQIKEM